jgi:hypothetical protein
MPCLLQSGYTKLQLDKSNSGGHNMVSLNFSALTAKFRLVGKSAQAREKIALLFQPGNMLIVKRGLGGNGEVFVVHEVDFDRAFLASKDGASAFYVTWLTAAGHIDMSKVERWELAGVARPGVVRTGPRHCPRVQLVPSGRFNPEYLAGFRARA